MTDREPRPWVPTELSPPRPKPVPELGWCARCKRVRPSEGGHDWQAGLDGCAYVAGVICPGCLTPAERLETLCDDFEGIFINPADAFEELLPDEVFDIVEQILRLPEEQRAIIRKLIATDGKEGEP